MTDYLDPEANASVRPWEPLQADMHCISCQCPWNASDDVLGPQDGCYDESCACHAVYWMTVPENVKRRLWGDR